MEYEERRKELIERYKKLRKDAELDIKFSKANMEQAFDTTEKVMKWLGTRSMWLQLHHSFEYKRMEAWKKAFEYYKTDYPFQLNTKEEYQNMIKVDPVYSEMADLAKITSDIVDYIDATIDNLKNRQWEIKNFIEWSKFTHGQ